MSSKSVVRKVLTILFRELIVPGSNIRKYSEAGLDKVLKNSHVRIRSFRTIYPVYDLK